MTSALERLLGIIISIFIIPVLEAQLIAHSKRVKRIVGGEEVGSEQDSTFVVCLRKKVNNKYHQFCGGSIIDSQFILTAAHCIKSNTVRDIQVVIGTTDLNSIQNEDPQFTRNVIEMYYHDDYNTPEQYANDIGLMKVDRPILNDGVNISYINLPEPAEPILPGIKVWIYGWGRTYGPDAPLSSTLKVANVTVIPHDRCVTTYRRYMRRIYLNQFCTHETDKMDTFRRGICNADSGGPATVRDTILERILQIGIISWALKDPDCAAPKFPDVYTKVSDHINWIYKQMKYCRKP